MFSYLADLCYQIIYITISAFMSVCPFVRRQTLYHYSTCTALGAFTDAMAKPGFLV